MPENLPDHWWGVVSQEHLARAGTPFVHPVRLIMTIVFITWCLWPQELGKQWAREGRSWDCGDHVPECLGSLRHRWLCPMVELHHQELALQGGRLCDRPGDSHHKSVWIGAAQATSDSKAITRRRSRQWICARLCGYVVDRVAGGWEAFDGQAPRSYTHGKDGVHPYIAENFDPPMLKKKRE